MSDDMQYDSTLGGPQDLPGRLTLSKYTVDRVREIQVIKHTLQTSRGIKLAFQRLPKHMRRRVMSHNVKRLPRRLREIHMSQFKKSGMPPCQKRPSRKYRRRPRNLLDKYNRRQHKNKWLETHIWHAKRFHMIEKWGYKLAESPCDKAFRACYRATTKHCLVQDISFFSCIEISGPSDVLINRLKSVSNSNGGLSIGAKVYVTGKREGQTILFHNDGSNKNAVGTVYFHWKPTYTSEITSTRIIWLWVHAAFYEEALNLFKKCFNLTAHQTDTETHVNEETNVKLIELRNHLNRFRLTGPLSLAVLYQTLQIVILSKINSNWFKDYIENKQNLQCFLKQCEYWRSLENISSPSEVPPHSILALVVKDPRFNMPQTKIKATLQLRRSSKSIEMLDHLGLGPIWEVPIRKAILENKLSNAKFAELRSELLVPGTELGETGEAIPVMLIQRPGDQSEFLGYGSGWDLIVPAGWGNTFWMSLVLWGGRAGGLREFNSIEFESGRFPFLMPDTQAGQKEEDDTTQTCKKRFFSLPPNRRTNYTKYGIIQPFSFNWKLLIQNWKSPSAPVDDFFVLRDKKLLLQIQQLLNNKEKMEYEDCSLNCIVPVRLRLKGKGLIKTFATICLPNSEDIVQNKEPVEPLRKDTNQKLRKQIRDDHKGLLKKLRRKRIRAKRKGEIIPIDMEILKKYQEEMRKLWLPEDPNLNIRKCCSREIIGFVVNGRFCYSRSKGCAVGYIAMGAIKSITSQSPSTTVLLRNTTSRQYRTADLEIIV